MKKLIEKRLSKWDYALKEYGLKMNEEKIIVMKVTRENSETKIRFRGHYLKKVEEFVYLGNFIIEEVKIQKEVSRRIQSSAKCYHLIKSQLWNNDIPLSCKKNI